MTRRRVAITGLGLISPFGGDLADFFARIVAGESAVRFLQVEGHPKPLAVPFASCPGFDANASLGRPLAGSLDRFAQLGVAAAFAAWENAGLSRVTDGESRANWGVAWGSGMGGSLTVEKTYRDLWQRGRERLSPLTIVLAMHNAANAHISIQLGLGGVSMTHAVACASSAIAIGEAFRRVRSGEATIMVTGGSDVPQAYGLLCAWDAMRIIATGDSETSPAACRPFATDRNGLVLGEGGGALVLEDWEHAAARGAPIHAEIIGYGTTCDHVHLVRPEISGQARAIGAALDDAGLTTDQIDYVNAHGTATIEGDPVEIAALKAVFGTHAARLPVSATKSMHAHLLGAAGVIEAITTVLALREQSIPPTANLHAVDPACTGVDHVAIGRRDVPLRAALSNSFAFGGSNAVLAFRAAPR